MLWASLNAPQGFDEHRVNRLGCQLGVTAYAPDGRVHPADPDTARYLGHRVAMLLQVNV